MLERNKTVFEEDSITIGEMFKKLLDLHYIITVNKNKLLKKGKLFRL